MDEHQQKHWTFERLRHSLQALALPVSAQVLLFPEFAIKTDELVLDFDHWRRCALENYTAEMTNGQRESLTAIDALISNASAEVWHENALADDPFWQSVRELSARSLDAFGWPLETPPSYSREFVRGTRK